jgi:hypothetical protein
MKALFAGDDRHDEEVSSRCRLSVSVERPHAVETRSELELPVAAQRALTWGVPREHGSLRKTEHRRRASGARLAAGSCAGEQEVFGA